MNNNKLKICSKNRSKFHSPIYFEKNKINNYTKINAKINKKIFNNSNYNNKYSIKFC